MSSYQQILLVGHVGQDPDLKYLQSGDAVCNFSVAVTEKWGSGEDKKEKTVWFRVAAWKKLAETVNQYVKKGSQIMVIGTVEARAYTTNDGKPGVSLEVNAREVRFLGSKGENGTANSGNGAGDFAPPPKSEDIPF